MNEFEQALNDLYKAIRYSTWNGKPFLYEKETFLKETIGTARTI